MATSNFYVKNAKSYYALKDTYEVENEEGVMEEFTHDEWEWDNLLDYISYCGKEGKFFVCT